MTHDTLLKFGFPGTIIHEYEHWYVVLRPKQATLGALVLIAKSEATAFSDLPAEAYSEMETITKNIEQTLKDLFDYDKINYLMLMMVDPQVHFHVLPRYEHTQSYENHSFTDPGWPGPPNLGHANDISDEAFSALLETLKSNWPA